MSVTNAGDDPVIKQYRDQISDNDLKIIDAINKRLKLVKQLRVYKEQHGVDFLDPAREEWMLTFVARANKGPLSQDALAELYRSIVEITKREAAKA
jgi:chorismate mutase